MSGCSSEETSQLNNKQSQEASIRCDAASRFGSGGTTQKEILLLHLFVRIVCLSTSAVYKVSLQNRCTDRKQGERLVKSLSADDGMHKEVSTKSHKRAEEDPHKASFTAANIQLLGNTRVRQPSRNSDACVYRCYLKALKLMFMCSCMEVFMGTCASGGAEGVLRHESRTW